MQESGIAQLSNAEGTLDKGSHKAYVEISAGYTIVNKKVTIDKKSLTGTLTIDKDSPKKLVKKLDVQSLTISGDRKTIDYTAKVSGSSDKVTGKMVFGSPAGFDKKSDQSISPGKSTLTVVLGKTTLKMTDVAGKIKTGA